VLRGPCDGDPPRVGTRKAVAEELGVPYALIDQHTDRLVEKGRLRRVVPGVFEPVHVRANRAITLTALPTGGAKLEVGDQVLDLQTPWEASYARNLLDGLLKSARLDRRGEKSIPES
jgi:hypothetical protein